MKPIAVTITIAAGGEVVTLCARLPEASAVKVFAEELRRGALLLPYGPCLSADLYRSYQRHCRISETEPLGIEEFSARFSALGGVRRVIKRVSVGGGEAGKKSRAQRTVFVIGRPGRGVPEAQWIDAGVGKFREQLRSLLDAEGEW